jgi:type I restriction enzyme S subunit
MVLRAKPGVVLPEFLPFFMQSDLFMERAKEISVGSLSPTINWKVLAKEEFALPPLEEQRRLTDALGAALELEESTLALSVSLWDAGRSWLEHEFLALEQKWPEKTADAILDRITVGIVVRPADLYVPQDQGIPALRSLNVLPHRVLMEDLVYISREGHAEHAKSQLHPGDVVIVRSGRPGDAAVVPDSAGQLNCIDLIICGPSQEVVPDFLCAALNSRFGRKQSSAGTAGTAQQHFNVGMFKAFRVPVPPRSVQIEFVEQMQQVTQAVTDGERRLSDARATKSCILRRALAR